MKKKILPILLLISVTVLLTACTPKKNNGGETTTTGSQEENLKGSLFDIVKLGKNIKCTFSSKSDGDESSGTTYTSGGKARSDFLAKSADGEEFESHTITDSDWIYIWTSMAEQGTKMKISDLPKNENQPGASKLGDVNNPFDYKCSPWMPDNSKFNVPTNITFVDFTETMKALQEQTDKMKEELKGMCGTCDLAGSAEDIVTCKTNLGCE